MELASQVGERDGAASAGKVWVSRRPESRGIGEKLFTFFQPFLPIFRTKKEDVLRPIKATFSRNIKNAKKASDQLSKIFSFWYTENGESSYKTA